MNRKEAIIVGMLLLSTFVGSTFAAPAIQQMFIVNDPLNVRVVGGAPSLHTTSVDIEVVKIIPATTTGALGIYVLANSQAHVNVVEGFSFAPAEGFVQVESVFVTIVYHFIESSPGDMFSISLNRELQATPKYSVLILLS